MKRIAIVSTGYGWLPCEPGPSRFYYIAKTFVDAGWDVELITVDFQHFQKKPRDIELIRAQNYPFRITFVHAPAYKKNVDIRRIISNRAVAKNVIRELRLRIRDFDAVYCSIPANNVAARLSELCKDNNVPFIVDIEDLWPEAMSMVLKNDAWRNFLLKGMKDDAEITYRNASAVVGTSEDYTERAFLKRPRDIPAKTVYVGCDITAFDRGVQEFRDEIIKPEGEFWVTYAGSISTSYDIKTLIDAGKDLADQGVHIQLLGTGSQKEELETYVKNNDIRNVHFWGFVPYPKMAAALSKSDVLVNSFVKGAPQSIVNKIGDYLAAGKPMINTLENPIFCKLVEENGVGVNVEPEDAEALKTAFKMYKEENEQMLLGGKKARNLAEKSFNRVSSYRAIEALIRSLSSC